VSVTASAFLTGALCSVRPAQRKLRDTIGRARFGGPFLYNKNHVWFFKIWSKDKNMRFAPGTPQSVINAAIGTFGPGSGLAPRPIPRPVPIPNGVNPEDYERMITEGGSINIPGGGTISSAGGMARPIPRQFLDGAMGGGKPNVNLNVINDRFNAQLAAPMAANQGPTPQERDQAMLEAAARSQQDTFNRLNANRPIPSRPNYSLSFGLEGPMTYGGGRPNVNPNIINDRRNQQLAAAVAANQGLTQQAPGVAPPIPQFDPAAFNTFMGGLDDNQRNLIHQFASQRVQDALPPQFLQMQQSPMFQQLAPRIPGGGIATLFGGQPMGGFGGQPMGGFGGQMGGFGGQMGSFGQPMAGFGQLMGGFGQPMGGFGGFGQPMGGFGGFGQPMGGFGGQMGGFGGQMGGFGGQMGGFGGQMGGFGQPMGSFGQPMAGFGQLMGGFGGQMGGQSQGQSPFGSSSGRGGVF
jgi:hypothetical protein